MCHPTAFWPPQFLIVVLRNTSYCLRDSPCPSFLIVRLWWISVCSLIMRDFGVVVFEFILHDVHWDSWMCRLRCLSVWGNFLPIFLQLLQLFSPPQAAVVLNWQLLLMVLIIAPRERLFEMSRCWALWVGVYKEPSHRSGDDISLKMRLLGNFILAGEVWGSPKMFARLLAGFQGCCQAGERRVGLEQVKMPAPWDSAIFLE